MSAWTQCAVLSGTKTLDGRLIARSVDGLPFLLQPGMTVHFVPPVLDSPRSAVVEEVAFGAGEDYHIRFKGIESKNEALPLVGCYCLVEKDQLDELMVAAADESLEGFKVFTLDGNYIGTALGLEMLPMQCLLHIGKENGKEVLIPFVDEFVDLVDYDSRRIEIDAPTSLLDLEY